jgi:hypothetical protein
VTPWVPMAPENYLTHTHRLFASDHGYDRGSTSFAVSDFGDTLNPFFTPSRRAQLRVSELMPRVSSDCRPHNGSDFVTRETLGLSPTTSNLPTFELLDPVATCSLVINGRDLIVTLDFATRPSSSFQLAELRNIEILRSYPLCNFTRSNGLESFFSF